MFTFVFGLFLDEADYKRDLLTNSYPFYSYRYGNKDNQSNKFYLFELIGGLIPKKKHDADRKLAEIQNKVEIYFDHNDPSHRWASGMCFSICCDADHGSDLIL